jgi:TonB family protein
MTIVDTQRDTMSAYANSLRKPERFDMYIRKLQSICAMHGVPIGSRMNLSDFMQKLAEDRHLAMDFWAFIGKLSDREGGELSDDQVLAVVVESITHSAHWQEDGGLKRAVDDLRAMIAGVDIQVPESGQVQPAPFPVNESRSHQGDGEWRTRPVVEMPLRPPTLRAAFTQETAEGEASHAADSPTTPSRQLEEELLRLELTRLVKQYFDDIDKRVSRLEPHSEGVTSSGTVASATTRRSLEEPEPGEMEELRLRPRHALDPPSFMDTSLAAKRQNPQARIPMEGYSQLQEQGKAVYFLLIVAVLIGAGFAVYPYQTQLREGFTAWALHQVRSGSAFSSARRSAPPPVPSYQDPSADQTGQTEPDQPSSDQRAHDGTSIPPPFSASNQATSARSQAAGDASGSIGPHKAFTNRLPIQTAPTRSKAAGSGAGSSGSHRAGAVGERIPAEPAAVDQAEQPPADGVLSAEAARLIQVDPSVMEANLIMSRVPAYPEAAKMSRVIGQVVMQAIISEDGTVKRVHVTEGDSRLRAAAVEAVYRWRYRPYLVDGQPAEVTTTITIDFNPDR